ncbi:hypothetical protein L7F22_036215 [Adiantum nelumboides]|nr:hypothetical protein [Adiantum nelumboides]
MAPSNGSSKRSSLSRTPQQQPSISSFFTPKAPSSSPFRRKKPLLVVSASAEKKDSFSSATETPRCTSISGTRSSQNARHSQESVSPHELMPSLASAIDITNLHSVCGKRIKVYWPLDDAWYEGTVKEYVSPNHIIQYDDGDEEAVCLKTEKFEWIPCDKTPHKRKLRKLSFLKPSFEGGSCGLTDDGSQEKALERNQNIPINSQITEECYAHDAEGEDHRAKNLSNDDYIADNIDQVACTDGDDDNDVDAEWTLKSLAEPDEEDVDFEIEDNGKKPKKLRKEERPITKSKKIFQKATAPKKSAPQRAGPENALDKSIVVEDTHSTPHQSCNKNSGPCESVPENVKEVVTRLHVDAKSDGKDPNAYVDALVDDLGGNASLSQGGASGSMSTQASGNVHVSATGTSASKSNVGSSSKKRKGAQGPLASAFSLQARKQADQALRRFFYAEDIPEWKVRSPFFLEMVKAIGQVGSSYVPPTYNGLRTTELNDEVKCIGHEIMGVRENWKKHGCTIVCDGLFDTRRRSIINFLACSIHGSVFLKSVDTYGETKTSEFIFKQLKDVINEVGPSNVVQSTVLKVLEAPYFAISYFALASSMMFDVSIDQIPEILISDMFRLLVT